MASSQTNFFVSSIYCLIKHFNEQVEVLDLMVEPTQLLDGVSVAISADLAEAPTPRGGEEVPVVQLSRLLDAHKVILGQVHKPARRASKIGNDGTNDLAVSQVLRTNELQVWFVR